MALVRAGMGPRDLGYAVVRNIEADKGSGITRVNIGLYFDAEDRAAGIGPGESLPPARAAKTYSLQGYDLTLADIYVTLAGQPDWQGWASDEGGEGNV